MSDADDAVTGPSGDVYDLKPESGLKHRTLKWLYAALGVLFLLLFALTATFFLEQQSMAERHQALTEAIAVLDTRIRGLETRQAEMNTRIAAHALAMKELESFSAQIADLEEKVASLSRKPGKRK